MSNRIIKFRAWDKKNKKMFHYSNHILWDMVEDILFPNRYLPMQFTGLKDKNGKEIYEGDIVNREVIGEPDEIGYGPWNNRIINVEVKFEKGSFNITGYDVYKHTFEVIGNIYENENLLK